MHWADTWAKKVIAYRGEKKEYTCASAVTPSGVCHIGHLREALSAYFVSRGLQNLGKKTRLIHGWDDYDRFRKVPKGVSSGYEQYIGMPVCEVLDPEGCHDSYAHHFSKPFEEELERIDVQPEFIYHSTLWKGCKLTKNIKDSLEKRADIIGILNKFREQPLEESWYPVEIYCKKCRKDTTRITSYDGEYSIEYSCTCGHSERIDFRNSGNVKLKWRVDWPSKWAYFNIDFESAGKDHYAAGGSRDTGNRISKKIFGYEPPLPLKGGYEFVSIKGLKGKMSSSKGELITTSQLLEVLTPEVIKFVFLRSRPEKEISFSFDMDLINLYNYYDTSEEAFFGKGAEKIRRIYELSRAKIQKKMPVQVPFSLLVTISQVIPKEKVVEVLKRVGYNVTGDEELFRKVELAKNWAQKYAPEQMVLRISDSKPELGEKEKEVLRKVYEFVSKTRSPEKIHEYIYELAKEKGIEPKEIFKTCYRVLLGKEQGPKLGHFLLLVDDELLRKRFL